MPALAAPASTEPWFGLSLPGDRAARSARVREAYRHPDIAPLSLRLQEDADPYVAVQGRDVYAFMADIVDLTRASRRPGAQYWGRIAGGAAERQAAAYVHQKFQAFGLDAARTDLVLEEQVARHLLDHLPDGVIRTLPHEWVPR